MIIRKLLTGGAVAAVLAGAALAQTPAPTTPTRPAAPAPAAPAAPATTRPATAPPAQAQLVNLNTAPAAELDKLPQIGDARAKAIVQARAKGRFKDWNDFVARKVVPKNAEDAIKEKVRF